MHDCPKCRVPLHGHERVCPSCGTPQKVTKSTSRLLAGDDIKKPATNPTPIIITLVAIGILFFVMGQTSWIGQLLTKGPTKADPLAKMTFQEARTTIDTTLNQGFTTAGVKGTVKWQREAKDVDKLSPGPVEVTVDAALNDPEQHKAIVDPIKDYMDKAQITSLVFNDTKNPKTQRNWTYRVSTPAPGAEGADAGAAAAPAQAPATAQ
jgi:hypothetical protein